MGSCVDSYTGAKNGLASRVDAEAEARLGRLPGRGQPRQNRAKYRLKVTVTPGRRGGGAKSRRVSFLCGPPSLSSFSPPFFGHAGNGMAEGEGEASRQAAGRGGRRQRRCGKKRGPVARATRPFGAGSTRSPRFPSFLPADC